MANGSIKKDTEYTISTDYCSECKSFRYFYRHKDGGDFFCQICGNIKTSKGELKNGLENVAC